jgi:hypothetical protein
MSTKTKGVTIRLRCTGRVVALIPDIRLTMVGTSMRKIRLLMLGVMLRMTGQTMIVVLLMMYAVRVRRLTTVVGLGPW